MVYLKQYSSGLDGLILFWKTTQIRINKKEINFDFSVNNNDKCTTRPDFRLLAENARAHDTREGLETRKACRN